MMRGAKPRQAHHQLGAIGELLIIVDIPHLRRKGNGSGRFSRLCVSVGPLRAADVNRGPQEILLGKGQDDMKLAAARQDCFGNQYIGAAGERAIGDQHLGLVEDRAIASASSCSTCHLPGTYARKNGSPAWAGSTPAAPDAGRSKSTACWRSGRPAGLSTRSCRETRPDGAGPLHIMRWPPPLRRKPTSLRRPRRRQNNPAGRAMSGRRAIAAASSRASPHRQPGRTSSRH